MELTLNRVLPIPGLSTTGDFLIEGVKKYVTMERAPDDRLRIPAGRYQVVAYPSPRFQQLLADMRAKYTKMIGISEVPRLISESIAGRDPIEIHVANSPGEVEGCIGIGMKAGPSGLSILASRDAVADFYPQFMDTINRGEEVWLTVNDPGAA